MQLTTLTKEVYIFKLVFIFILISSLRPCFSRSKKSIVEKRTLIVLPIEIINTNSIIKEQAAKLMITEGMKQEKYILKLSSNFAKSKQKIIADAMHLRVEKVASKFKIHAVLMDLKKEESIQEIQLDSENEQQLIYNIRLALAALFNLQLHKKLTTNKKIKKKNKKKINNGLGKFKSFIKNIKKNINKGFSPKQDKKNKEKKEEKSLQESAKKATDNPDKQKELDKKETKKIKAPISGITDDNPKAPKYLIFKSLNLLSVGYVQDLVLSKASIFDIENNFKKYTVRFDGSLFYDDITNTALKYGVTFTQFASLEDYEMPLNYNFNFGIENFPDNIPVSIFVRLNYEYYTFITLPEFGKGFQIAFNQFVWASIGIFKEFPLKGLSFLKFNFFKHNRLELEFAQILKSNTRFKSSGAYTGNMEGQFIKLFFLTSLAKKYFVGFFYSKYTLEGNLGSFSLGSTISGIQLGRSF